MSKIPNASKQNILITPENLNILAIGDEITFIRCSVNSEYFIAIYGTIENIFTDSKDILITKINKNSIKREIISVDNINSLQLFVRKSIIIASELNDIISYQINIDFNDYNDNLNT